MTHMANYWSGKNQEVSLITLSGDSEVPFYPVDPAIHRHPLGLRGTSVNAAQGLLNNLRRIQVLRATLKKIHPQVVISFVDATNVLTLLASRGLRTPVIVAEHSNPFMTAISRTWKSLRAWSYPWADGLVVLNGAARDYFHPGLQRRTTVIPNPIRISGGGVCKEEIFPHPTVAALGRLSEEKRIDMLLDAFARLKDLHPAWRLAIMGEGPLRAELEARCQALQCSSRVRFLGLVKDPHACLRQADLFVLSSRFEGFPLALGEAMACGLPVISTEYSAGVHEIIREGTDGLIVPVGDLSALVRAMDTLMGDEAERKRLGRKAREILDRFSLEKIMGQWDGLIQHVAEGKPPGNPGG
jgi:GalNAc-alpha-(1->4)-GalNAc-alpha-(1->3)-diNAcBac-PP-undecaprenol alpha-1,4-N-acetyl-D-galactosaminyltransferase